MFERDGMPAKAPTKQQQKQDEDDEYLDVFDTLFS